MKSENKFAGVLLLCWLGIALSSVALGQTVTIGTNAADKLAYIGNAIHRINRDNKFDLVPIIDNMIKTRQDRPWVDTRTALLEVGAMRDKNVQIVGTGEDRLVGQMAYDVGNSLLNIASAVPTYGIIATVAKEGVFWAQQYEESQFRPIERLNATLRNQQTQMFAQEYGENVLNQAYDMAKSDPEFARRLNLVMQTEVNASTTDRASAIFNHNSDYANTENIRQIREWLGPDGVIRTDMAQLRGEVQGITNRMDVLIGQNRATLGRIDALQRSFTAFERDQRKKEQAAAERQQQAQVNALTLEAAQSGIYILSSLAKLGGSPALGQQISVVGGAAIKVATSVAKFTEDAATLASKFGTSLGNVMSGAILSGNLIGAAMSIFSLFGDSGPSADQMILDQLGQVRQQIRELSQQMHERFDRIDKSLNEIYVTMNQRFDQLTQIILTGIGDLRQLEEDTRLRLYDLQSSLNRIDLNLFEYLQDTNLLFLRQAVDRVFNAPRDFPNGPPPYDTYFKPLMYDVLWSWTVTESVVNSTVSGASNRLYDDDHLFEELQKPLDTNLNYLAEFVRLRLQSSPFTPTPLLTNQRLANPRVWETGASALVKLMTDWPDHYTTLSTNWSPADTNGLFGVYAVGNQVQLALRRMTLQDNGTRSPLFANLVQNQQIKADSLISAIAAFEQSYRQRNNLGNAELWGATYPAGMTNAQWKAHRQNIASAVVNSLLVPPAVGFDSGIEAAGKRLRGSTALISSYAALGLSQSLQANELLRSLLYGTQRLPDSDVVALLYSDALSQLNSADIVVVRNPKLVFADTQAERRQALSDLLDRILDNLVRIQRVEPFRGVSSTMERVKPFVSMRFTGQVNFQNNPSANAPVTLVFRNRDGAAPFTLSFPLDANGKFVVTIPDGNYELFRRTNNFSLGIRAERFLQRAIPLDISHGNLFNLAPDRLIIGDINGDNVINFTDYTLMRSAWGTTSRHRAWNPNANLNGDSLINDLDLALLRQNFGKRGDP